MFHCKPHKTLRITGLKQSTAIKSIFIIKRALKRIYIRGLARESVCNFITSRTHVNLKDKTEQMRKMVLQLTRKIGRGKSPQYTGTYIMVINDYAHINNN